jgi:regulatory protein
MAQAHLVLVDWLPFAEQCFVKKFGSHVSADFTERTKQQQFLNYRGYTAEQIKQVFNRLPTGDLGNGV